MIKAVRFASKRRYRSILVQNTALKLLSAKLNPMEHTHQEKELSISRMTCVSSTDDASTKKYLTTKRVTISNSNTQ